MSLNLGSSITFFILGLTLLLKGADILTDAASSIARKLGIASFVVGLVVVGIGTSIPELAVALLSNLRGHEQIGIGAVGGSNTLNILLILGVSAVISPLAMTKTEVVRHVPLNFIAVLAVIFLIILSGPFFGITRFAGIVLLLLFIGWLWYVHSLNKKMESEEENSLCLEARSSFKNCALAVGGLIGIIVGGEWLSESSVSLARTLGLSDGLIGLTVLSLGTSLPELFTSAVAARKKEYGVAVGNVIGSNIFDFLMVLGLASAMRPMRFTSELFVDFLVTLGATLLLFCAIFVGKKYVLERWEGAIFVVLYIFYAAHLFSARF